MAKFDPSASQRKALTSLGIAFDVNDTYDSAAAKLSAAGVDKTGQVNGVAPRDAKKIGDSEYAAMLRRDVVSNDYYQANRGIDRF